MTHRIVSLIARATEIVCALGLEDALVGRSHECDYPPSVARLPVCSTSKVKEEAHSEAIDRQVRRIVGDGLSVYQVDPDLLNRLAPTVIVTQIQCDVYAVSLKDVERAVCELVSSRPAIVSLEPLALSDVWRDKWIDPLMIAGNWVPELVDYSGGVDPLGGGKHSGYLDIAQLVAVDPGVIAIMPCGFDIERAWREMPALVSRPEWQQLSAVRLGPVAVEPAGTDRNGGSILGRVCDGPRRSAVEQPDELRHGRAPDARPGRTGQRRGGLRAAAGRPGRRDAPGRLLGLVVRPGLPNGLRPRAARQ